MALATLAGATGLSTISGSHVEALAVISGAAGVGAAVLSALQTFLAHEKLTTAHEKAAAEFGDLRRRVEMMLLTELDAVPPEMTAIRERWHELEAETPTIPGRIHRDVKGQFSGGASVGRGSIRDGPLTPRRLPMDPSYSPAMARLSEIFTRLHQLVRSSVLFRDTCRGSRLWVLEPVMCLWKSLQAL